MVNEQELKERIKALIKQETGISDVPKPVYEQTPWSDVYEKQYTKATGKEPFRTLPPDEQQKEVLKAKIKGLIVDDMMAELPPEMREKLEGPSLQVERGTLEERRRLAMDPTKQKDIMLSGIYGQSGGLIGGPLEKRERGEKLTLPERAEVAFYHTVKPALNVMSGGAISEWERKSYPGISKEKWYKDLEYEPKDIEAIIGSGIGALYGLTKGGPGAVSKAYRTLADARLLPKIMGSAKLSKLAKELLVRGIHGAGLAPTLAAAEAAKGLKEVPENLLHGLLLGEVFAAGGAINPNNKILGWLLRQTANRMMAGASGQYNPELLKNVAKGLATGEWDTPTTQQVFDELLMGFFSHKGTSAEQIEELLPKLRAAQERKAAQQAQGEALGKAVTEKYQAGMKEAKELSDIKVNPDIVALGEAIAKYEYLKATPFDPKKGRRVDYDRGLNKARVRVVELYRKAKGGMREGEAMAEELTALEKMKERVPGMKTPPPEPVPEPAAPGLTQKQAPAKSYVTTETNKTQVPPVLSKEPERTPVVPHDVLKDLHTTEHYVYAEGQFQKTEGKDIEIVPEIDTFIHKAGSGNKRVWVVIEGKSGLPIGVDATQERAIEMARAAIEQPTFKNLVEQSLASSGQSPRYIQAQGAAMSLLQKPTDLGVPEDIKGLEQRILAGEQTGQGTLQSHHEFNAEVGYMAGLPVADAAKMAAKKGEPGVALSLVRGGGAPVIIIERPYGKLRRNGDGSWTMNLNPGVDPESLKTAPGRPVEAKTPEERPKIRVPVEEVSSLEKRAAEMIAESEAQAAEVAKSEAERKKEQGLDKKIPVLNLSQPQRGEDSTVRLERGKERAARQRALGKSTQKTKAAVSEAEAKKAEVEKMVTNELLTERAAEQPVKGPTLAELTPPEPPEVIKARKKKSIQRLMETGKSREEAVKIAEETWPAPPAPEVSKPPATAEGEIETGVTYKPTAEAQSKLEREIQAARRGEEGELDLDMPKVKGLTIEDINWVMEDARKKGKETRGPFLGYLFDRARNQAAPPPMPDDVPPPEVARKSDVPKEKTWAIGRRATTNLRRLGEGGIRAARGLEEYARKRMQWTQRDLYGASNAANIIEQYTEAGQREKPSVLNMPARRADYRTRSEQTGQRIREILEGKRKPADEIESRSIDIIRTRLNEIQKMAEELKLTASGVYGEKKWKAIKNYYPHEWEGLEELWEGEIHRNMKDVIVDNIAKNQYPDLYRDPVTKEKSIEMAERYWEDMRHDLKTAKYGHLEMQRILDDEFVEVLRRRWEAKFPEKPFPLKLNDSVDVLFRYLAGADNRLAWLQEFGKDEHHKGWMIPEKVLEWSQKMENRDNREYMYRQFHNILRRDNYAKWQKFSRWVQTFQLTKMTFAFVPNSVQWLTNTVPNVTTKAALEALWDTAKFYGAAGPEAKKQAKDFFYTTGAGRLSAELQESLAAHPELSAKMSDILLKAYGFTGTEFYNRLYSAFAGKRYAEHLAAKLEKSGPGGWRSPQYLAELKKLGLDASDVESLIKDGPLTPKNAEKLAEASYNMTRLTQFMAESFFLPSSWSNPGMRIVTQFKNFAYNQTAMLYNEPFMQAVNFLRSKGRLGDLAPLIKTAVILPLAGAAIYHFKKEGTSKLFGLTFYEKMLAGKSEPLKWFSYIFNAGGFGIGSDIVSSLALGKSGIANLVGGPTISDISELVASTADTVGELSKGGKWARNRTKTIAVYWARFGGKTSPTAKAILSRFFPEYKKVTDFNMWSRLARDFYRKYKETYILKGPEVAEEIWQAFMETQGKEYEEMTAKWGEPRKLQKPTRREIMKWWDEMGGSPSERIPMSGEKKKETLGEFYY